MELAKGFIFMLDMVFGLLIALMLLTLISNILLSSKNIFPTLQPLQTTSQETLAALDHDGTLNSLFSQSSSQDNFTLSNALNDTLPNNIGGKIEVWLCTYVGSGGTGISSDDEDNDCTPSCSGDTMFTCGTYLRAITGGPLTNQVGVARRVFTRNSSSYGLAVMRTWYR